MAKCEVIDLTLSDSDSDGNDSGSPSRRREIFPFN